LEEKERGWGSKRERDRVENRSVSGEKNKGRPEILKNLKNRIERNVGGEEVGEGVLNEVKSN